MLDEKLANATDNAGTYGNVLSAIESRLDSIESQLTVASELLNQKIYSITVNDLARNEWNLDKPLIVTVEQHSKDDFIACFYDADVYGYGDSIPEALDDLKEQLVNQLEFLLEEEKRVTLGPVPQRQLDMLRRSVHEVTTPLPPFIKGEPFGRGTAECSEPYRKEIKCIQIH